MEIKRRKSRELCIGNVRLGGNNPIVVQSMTNTDTRDVEQTVEQIRQLEAEGCGLVRVAVLNEDAAWAIRPIREQVSIPLIADIHFDCRLAVAALEAGADALRINPGNIGGAKNIDRVVDAAKARNAAIRIGVNSGSAEHALMDKYHGPTPQAMAESAINHVRLLEERNFHDIKVSLKSSNVLDTVAANRAFASMCDYPIHLGVTEAGVMQRGAVKSALGIGLLLAEGIGDTIRVSLTADPVAELSVAWEILRSLGLGGRGPEIISCPTCGRTEIDLISLANEIERRLEGETEVFKVAVMGCVVNGPGEAREADIGLAGGRDKGIIFRHGEVIRTVRGGSQLLAAFNEELDKFLAERKGNK